MKFKDKIVDALEDLIDIAMPALVALTVAGIAFCLLAVFLWIGLEIALSIIEALTQAAKDIIAAIKA